MIDICPSCKGVWLDRGELDKLMEGVREMRASFHEWYEEDQAKRQQAPANTPYPKRPEAYSRNPYETYKTQPYDPRNPYERDPYDRKGPYKDPYYKYKYKKKKNILDILGDLFD